MQPDTLTPILRRAPDAHLFLYGPPGTGKSTLADALARELSSAEPIHVSAHSSMEAWELLSTYLPHGDGLRLADGAGITAWRAGAVLVVHEADRLIGTAAGHTLNVLLDARSVAAVRLADGERVTPAEGFRCIATSNLPPAALPPDALDRFSFRLRVGEPGEAALKRLPEPIRGATLAAYRALSPDSDAKPAWTFREALAFSQALGGEKLESPEAETCAALVWETSAPDVLFQLRSAQYRR